MSRRLETMLLRHITCAGVITVSEAGKLLEPYAQNQEYTISDLVSGLSNRLEKYKQTVKIVTNEITDEEMIIFLNLGCDETTKSQTYFSQAELEYFYILLEEIITSSSRQIDRMYALNLTSTRMKGSNYSKLDAERSLEMWCSMKYLIHSKDEYALGLRAICEFEPHIREHMQHLLENCRLCKKIVIWGCDCVYCGVTLHTKCVTRYANTTSKWPCCDQKFMPAHLENIQMNVSQRMSTFNDTSEQNTDDFDPSELDPSQLDFADLDPSQLDFAELNLNRPSSSGSDSSGSASPGRNSSDDNSSQLDSTGHTSTGHASAGRASAGRASTGRNSSGRASPGCSSIGRASAGRASTKRSSQLDSSGRSSTGRNSSQLDTSGRASTGRNTSQCDSIQNEEDQGPFEEASETSEASDISVRRSRRCRKRKLTS